MRRLIPGVIAVALLLTLGSCNRESDAAKMARLQTEVTRAELGMIGEPGDSAYDAASLEHDLAVRNLNIFMNGR